MVRQLNSLLHIVNEIQHMQIPQYVLGERSYLPDHLSDMPMSYLLLTAESLQMSLKPVLTVQGQLFNGAGHRGKGSF